MKIFVLTIDIKNKKLEEYQSKTTCHDTSRISIFLTSKRVLEKSKILDEFRGGSDGRRGGVKFLSQGRSLTAYYKVARVFVFKYI